LTLKARGGAADRHDMTEPNSARPPAGWYDNPGAPGKRYWDGANWTGHVAPPQSPGPQHFSTPYGAPTFSAGQGHQSPYPYGTHLPPHAVPGYGYPPVVPTQTSNVLSIIGIVCGAIAFLFFPILLGPAGIILGVIGLTRKERLAWVATAVSAAGLIIGMILGMLVWGY
jgi:hypothetical protein